jgi:cytoskeletal protein CcmA (bactofilin family)
VANIRIGSPDRKVVSIELTITFEDGSTETRREQGERIEIEATDLVTLAVNGNVYGTIVASGDVTCADVDGDVKAGGDVNCENIEGDARAGGDIRCEDIDGNVRAGADIHCNDISGNAGAGADIECNYIAGSVKAGGEIASMGFEEDE